MMREVKPTYGHGRSQSSMPLLPFADPPSPTSKPNGVGLPLTRITHRKRTYIALLAFASFVSLGLITHQVISRGLITDARGDTAVPPAGWVADSDLPTNWTLSPTQLDEHVLQYPPWVKGAPTQSFRDNLREDTKYITSWISAGWSTQIVHLSIRLN